MNIIHCKPPRCITVSEPQLDAIFLLSDPATPTYRCAYCETAMDKKFCSLHDGGPSPDCAGGR